VGDEVICQLWQRHPTLLGTAGGKLISFAGGSVIGRRIITAKAHM